MAASVKGRNQLGILRGDTQEISSVGGPTLPGFGAASRSLLNGAIARRECQGRRTASAPGSGLSSESWSLRLEH